MDKLREIYEKDIEREIQGVIKVDDESFHRFYDIRFFCFSEHRQKEICTFLMRLPVLFPESSGKALDGKLREWYFK